MLVLLDYLWRSRHYRESVEGSSAGSWTVCSAYAPADSAGGCNTVWIGLVGQ
jgi:hypothetical protein